MIHQDREFLCWLDRSIGKLRYRACLFQTIRYFVGEFLNVIGRMVLLVRPRLITFIENLNVQVSSISKLKHVLLEEELYFLVERILFGMCPGPDPSKERLEYSKN